jgi:CRISPR/Cas system-associated exonuclease Cas4 (RecB family)
MRISAKDLGWLATEDFCPRCFWIERHAKGLPYQMGFPGIFSSIDAYTKNIVERYFQKNKELPVWLKEIGEVKRIVSVKPSDFKVVRGDVTFSGIPDLIFQRTDNSYGIVDYKTARYTGNQDALMPIYQIQLNGYAYIAEETGYKPVKDLYLVYFEPPYKDVYEQITDRHTNHEGFDMPFKPVIHKIKRDTREVERLLKQAEQVYSEEKPPKVGLDHCKDCERLDSLIAMLE